MKIKLHFNKYTERWFMKTEQGYTIWDMPDCIILNMFFQLLDKEKENIYELKAEKE